MNQNILVKLANESPLVRNLLGADGWRDIVAITPSSVVRRVGKNQFNADFKGIRNDKRTNQMINLIYSDVYKFLGKKYGLQSYAPSPLYSFHLAPQEFADTTGDLKPDADPETTTVDGLTQQGTFAGADWATIRGDVGNFANDSNTSADVQIRCDSITNKWDVFTRSSAGFDTSIMGSGAVASSADFKLVGTGSKFDSFTSSISVVSSSPASNTALVAGDFNGFGTTRWASEIAISSWNASGINTFSLNATGLAGIVNNGVTNMGTTIDQDIDNSEPIWSSGAKSSVSWVTADNGSNEPILNVTYTVSTGTMFNIF